MTYKPEVVAWLKVTHATEDNWDIVIADRHKTEAVTEIGNRYTIPLIRLTDHEAARAADKARIAELEGLSERLKQEAQIHAQEARTANATIAEIYRVVSGGKGEPGNWHGSEPVRARIARLENALLDIAGKHHHSASAGEYFAEVARAALAQQGKKSSGPTFDDCTIECGAFGTYCRCAAEKAAQQGKEGE